MGISIQLVIKLPIVRGYMAIRVLLHLTLLVTHKRMIPENLI